MLVLLDPHEVHLQVTFSCVVNETLLLRKLEGGVKVIFNLKEKLGEIELLTF